MKDAPFGRAVIVDVPFPRRITIMSEDTSISGSPHQDLKCWTCGYDLTGLTERRCPECGEPFDPGELRHLYSKASRDRAWRLVLVRHIALVLAVFLACSGLSCGVREYYERTAANGMHYYAEGGDRRYVFWCRDFPVMLGLTGYLGALLSFRVGIQRERIAGDNPGRIMGFALLSLLALLVLRGCTGVVATID